MSSSPAAPLLSRLRVAVVGGGVSGLATASSLLRLGASRVTLYDRHSSPSSLHRSHSPATVVSANGVRVLDALDVLPALRPQSSMVSRLTQRSARGDLLSSFQPSSVIRSRTKDGNALTSLATPYSALHAALMGSLPASAVRWGREVKGVERKESGFSLSFAQGEAQHADLIVAADGVNSTTRSNFVHSRATQPSPLGGVLVEAVTQGALGSEQGKEELMEVWGNGQRFGCVGIGGGRVYWYATVNESWKEATASPAAFAETFSAFPAHVRDLIASTPTSSYHSAPLVSLPPTPPLHRDAVVLVGSSSCVLPPDYHQHAAQCLESALTLALSLRSAASLEEALARYERLRLSRLQFVHSAALSEVESAIRKGRMMSSLRDMASSLMPKQVSNATYEAALTYNVLKDFPELSDDWQGIAKAGGGTAARQPGTVGQEAVDDDWDEDEDDEEDEIAKRRNAKK